MKSFLGNFYKQLAIFGHTDYRPFGALAFLFSPKKFGLGVLILNFSKLHYSDPENVKNSSKDAAMMPDAKFNIGHQVSFFPSRSTLLLELT